MMSTTDPKVLAQVRFLCRRLEEPNWMAQPEKWVWRRPDGNLQGFAPLWPHPAERGFVNLLWLSMDMHQPPQHYDANKNALYTLIMRAAGTARLMGEPLTEVASIMTLRQFHAALPAGIPPGDHPLERAYPLLKYLAAHQLAHQGVEPC